MTFSIGLLLALIGVALVFFAFEWVAADVVGMGLLLVLVLTGLLPPARAFAGFGSDTSIMIFSLLVMTAALIKTGMVDVVGRALLRHGGRKPFKVLVTVVLVSASVSAFISNTAATAFMLPVVLGIATRARIAPAQLLLPLAFASILTSSVTLVSTSTNLVVSGLMSESGMAPMGMFELAPVGIPIAIVGVLYLLLVGRHLIPPRESPGSPIEAFGLRSYLSEILIPPDSALVGKTLREFRLGQDLDLNVVRLVRADAPDRYLLPAPDLHLCAGDVLVVEGPREEVLKVKDVAGIEIRPEVTMRELVASDEETLIAEALVVPDSPLVGRTLRGVSFRDRFGVQVLGLHRHGKNILRKLSRVTLRAGDLLLVQGRRSRMAALNEEHVVSAMAAVEERRIDRGRAARAALIFVGVLGLATFGFVPLAVAGFLGVFLVFATRCVTPADTYREVEWRAVILIASMLGVGVAMQETGSAGYLAGLVVSLTEGLDSRWVLAGFFVLTVLLTQPMSNQAAAAVILPVALATGEQLEANPRAFAMMVAVAASCSYLTPLEPACLLVYGPGRYRFVDFFRVGAPLTILIFLVALWLVPAVWPLHPVPDDKGERSKSCFPHDRHGALLANRTAAQASQPPVVEGFPWGEKIPNTRHENGITVPPPMKLGTPSSKTVLQELITWCKLARDVLNSSLHTMEITEVRSLKQHLLRRHERHLNQLRDLRGRPGFGRGPEARRVEIWAQVIAAMKAPSEQAALAACGLLERTILAVYERAADRIDHDSDAMRLVLRQRFELKCSVAYQLPIRQRSLERTARASESHSAFNESVAVAS